MAKFILCTQSNEWLSDQKFIGVASKRGFSLRENEEHAKRYATRHSACMAANWAVAHGLKVYLREVAS